MFMQYKTYCAQDHAKFMTEKIVMNNSSTVDMHPNPTSTNLFSLINTVQAQISQVVGIELLAQG
jgi:hypothetical protein